MVTDRLTWTAVRIKDLIHFLGKAVEDDVPLYTVINQIESMSEELHIRAKESKRLIIAAGKREESREDVKEVVEEDQLARTRHEARVIKSIGHCYDGTGWCTCHFWQLEPSRCTLFGSAKKVASKSLNVCNKIYGDNYEGDA